MALFQPEVLEVNKNNWGGLDFVGLTIAVNLAVFEIEKLASYGRFCRGHALRASIAAKLNLLDNEEHKAGAIFIGKIIWLLQKAHGYVWNACKFLAYLCVIYAVVLIYQDAPKSSYYLYLIIAPAIYLASVTVAIIALWIFCFIVRLILGIKDPPPPDDDIRNEMNKLSGH